MKYIILRDNSPIIFPDWLTHRDVARNFDNITSAGTFALFTPSKVKPDQLQISVRHGSVSMNIDRDIKREEDD